MRMKVWGKTSDKPVCSRSLSSQWKVVQAQVLLASTSEIGLGPDSWKNILQRAHRGYVKVAAYTISWEQTAL